MTSETRGPRWGTEASVFPFHTGRCTENSECYGCVGTSRGTTEWTGAWGPGSTSYTTDTLSSLGSTPLQGQEEHRQQQRGFPAFPAVSETQAGPHTWAQALPQGGMDTPRGAPVQVPPASPGGLVQILSVQACLEAHDVTSISFNEVFSVHMSQSESSSLQVSTLPNLWGKCAVASHGL